MVRLLDGAMAKRQKVALPPTSLSCAFYYYYVQYYEVRTSFSAGARHRVRMSLGALLIGSITRDEYALLLCLARLRGSVRARSATHESHVVQDSMRRRPS
jgi:hypothetical protein